MTNSDVNITVLSCKYELTDAFSSNTSLPFASQWVYVYVYGLCLEHPIRNPADFHHISTQSLNLDGCRGTTDDVAAIPFHLSLSSAALRVSPNPMSVQSLMLSSHLFFCLPLLLAPFPAELSLLRLRVSMWPYHLSFPFFTMDKRSSCTPIAF